MPSDNKVKIILNTMILTMLSLLLSLSSCPEEPENHDDDQLDTTSHNFTWEIDTLGNYGSYLNDVWIVNENNIWVVGNIKTDSGTYNAAKWDGDKWNLLKVLSGYSPNYGIFYFSENDIWVTSGLPIHWNGSEWTLYHLWNMGVLDDEDGGVTSIWASSPSDIYFVGKKGSIVHYDVSTFTKMESGTNVDLVDIYGTTDGKYLFAVGNDDDAPGPSVVLEYFDGNWQKIYSVEGYYANDNYGWALGVDVLNDTACFSMAGGLWKYNYKTKKSNYIPSRTCHFNESAFKSVHVNALNDMFFGGSGMIYAHYNGSTWFYDKQIYESFSQIALGNADYRNNLAVIVGYCCGYGHAIVAKGLRN